MKIFLNKLMIILLIASGTYIVFYYWTANNVSDLRNLPQLLLTSIIIYLLIQLIKRFINKRNSWYDWFYYIGLITILTPLVLLSSSGEWIFNLTRYGSLFFVIPPIIELLISKRK